MKTTPQTPTSSRSEPLGQTLGALAIIIMATILIGMIFAATGCKSHKEASITKQTTATTTATARDMFRSVAATQSVGVETTTSGARELTRIHIDRDSDGRATDITVDKNSSGQNRTESKSAEASAAVSTSGKNATSETAIKEQTREVAPVKKESNTAAQLTVIGVFLALLAFIGISIYKKSTK